MKTIKVQPVTSENFSVYGQYTDLLNPSGYSLGDFFHDRIKMNVSGSMNMAFSALEIHKADPMIVTASEYHNTTQEGMVCLDDDMIVYLAPASKEPVPELTEAFLVPKGTMICLHTSVWHLAPIAATKETAHVLIVLPERTYFNDCIVVDYEEDQQIKIEM